MRPAANPIEGCVVPFSSVPSSAPSSVSEFSFKILFKFPLDVAIQTDFPLDRTLPPRILLQPPRPPPLAAPPPPKAPCSEESFSKSKFKILMSCSDDDHFDLSQFVGYNQIHSIRVIKEVRAIIASTVDETTPQRSNIAEKKK